MTDLVLLEVADGVATITLHDPDRRNAMTAAMGDALSATVADLAGRDDVRAAVLTGTPPAFSAGGDLGMIEDLSRRAREDGHDATELMEAFYRRFLVVRDLPVPVVAAINGHAIGAGCCVALACDLRVVAAEAKLALNFVRLGLHPGMGSTWFLPQLVGPQRAAEWLYTGRVFSGGEAAARGLALDALPGAEVLPAAQALAREIAASAPQAVRQLKASLAATRASTLPEQLHLEASAQSVNYATDDVVEGMAAARERRAATFTGV